MQVDLEGNPQEHSYWDLFTLMYEKEFTWSVANDDNRMMDGLSLRVEFCHSQHIRPSSLKNLGPCSFLEVLIGLSRRLAFAAGGQAPGWACQLMVNLELHHMTDPLSRRDINHVTDILENVIDRTYQPDGLGGFFPLAWPDEDQTQVELWYQMAAYIDEMHPEW